MSLTSDLASSASTLSAFNAYEVEAAAAEEEEEEEGRRLSPFA